MQTMELGLAVPQVLVHRLTRMALAGSSLSTRDRNELHLMSAEKVAAFFESWNAMLLEMFAANLAFAISVGPLFWFRWPLTTRLSRETSRHIQRTTAAVIARGVAPIHRRAVANAKRLRRG